MDVKKSQRVPSFTVSGIVRFFKRNNFRVKIRFSQAQHAISDFFKICFTEAAPQFLSETKRFARVKNSKFSALCDLPETIKNIFEKFRIFFLNFLFFKGFSLRKMGFLLFSVGEEWFSRYMRIPSGNFRRCKIDEIFISFYPWFSV